MNPSVLLIEDDPTLTRLLVAHLRERGHHIQSCAFLEEAEAVLEKWIPDVVLLDLLLPDGNGETLIPMVRAMGKPILLVISGQTGVEVRVRSLNLGADGFLVKPFTLPELDACLRAMVRRLGPTGQKLSWRGTTLEVHGQTLSCGEDRVVLTDLETLILSELMKHPGRVVSRETLEEKLFGWNVPVSNSLQVRVSTLRKNSSR